MKIKRFIALMMAVVMIAALFTGCSKTVDQVIDENTDETGDTAETAEETVSWDYEAARAAYPADEIVMTLGDEEITWDTFFNWICYSISNYEYTYGEITDFDADALLGGTVKDAVLEDAKYYLTLYRVIEEQAAELGAEYPEDVDETIQSQLDSALEYYEGDETKLAEYINSTYGTMENCKYVMKIDSLYESIFDKLYGENGEDLTEEEIEAGSEGLYMAKHILIQTVDEDGAALTEEELEAKREQIEDIKYQLDEYIDENGEDGLEDYFDELMNEYSEDGGLASYPDGYLFEEGDMVDEFFEATKNAEIGGISDIIETSYGYHIVMRLPINLDSTPMSYATYGYTYSLRYIIASQLFRTTFQTWVEEAGAETADFYDTIDLAQAFPALAAEEAAEEATEEAVG